MFKLSLAASALVAATLAAPSQATGAFRDREDPAVVREWNTLAEGTIPTSAGPTLPRPYAMMHIAMFDAVNSIEGGYTAYRVRVPATRFASSEAAAAQAAHDVLVSLYPANAAKFDTALSTRLATIQPLRAQLGAQVGREVAKKILEWRAGDGWATPQTFTPPALPGIWQPTPPNFPAAAFVQAGHAKPFALPTPYYFLPRRPPALNSQEYADAVNEIKAIGGTTSTVRTDEQSLSAKLWASVGYKTNWGGAWNQVARFMTLRNNLSLIESARLFALVNVAMQDGVQTAQASKFVYQVWRPVTAIQQAARDGNDATTADAGWAPLLPTPPIQDYPSTHSALGAAAAVVLAQSFGSDNVPFTMASPSALPEAPARSFTSFTAAAKEDADSRVRAGLHFRFATTAGLQLGERIGQQALTHTLGPVNTR